MTTSGDTPIQRDELTSLLSLCGTLAGLCIGIVAFINASHRGAATAIDEAGCLGALQSALRYCIDGPCGDGESLRPAVRFR